MVPEWRARTVLNSILTGDKKHLPRLGLCAVQVCLPPTVPASLSFMLESGAYLIDNGRMLVLWLGRALTPGWLAEVRT